MLEVSGEVTMISILKALIEKTDKCKIIQVNSAKLWTDLNGNYENDPKGIARNKKYSNKN